MWTFRLLKVCLSVQIIFGSLYIYLEMVYIVDFEQKCIFFVLAC